MAFVEDNFYGCSSVHAEKRHSASDGRGDENGMQVGDFAPDQRFADLEKYALIAAEVIPSANAVIAESE